MGMSFGGFKMSLEFWDKLGKRVAHIWDVVSGHRRRWRDELIYTKQIDLQRQLDKLSETINDVERNIILLNDKVEKLLDE